MTTVTFFLSALRRCSQERTSQFRGKYCATASFLRRRKHKFRPDHYDPHDARKSWFGADQPENFLPPAVLALLMPIETSLPTGKKSFPLEGVHRRPTHFMTTSRRRFLHRLHPPSTSTMTCAPSDATNLAYHTQGEGPSTSFAQNDQ